MKKIRKTLLTLIILTGFATAYCQTGVGAAAPKKAKLEFDGSEKLGILGRPKVFSGDADKMEDCGGSSG